MKAYKYTAVYRLTILSILLLIISSGCSLTRKLKDNESLVRKVTIRGVDKEFEVLAQNYVDKEQRPNNWLNLQFYYLFSRNGKKNIGEPPAILDSNLVGYSRIQIEKFLRNKGYLKARVSDSIYIKNKRAELIFTATQGPMFRVRNYTDSIADQRVRSLYQGYKPRAHVKPGSRFDTDSLAYDRDELYMVMKRNGYYDFYRQYINYNYDSTFNSSVADVKIIIDNPDGKIAHPVYTLNNTLITISRSSGRTTEPNALTGRVYEKPDTIRVDSQFTFVDYSGRFKPRIVTDYIFQKKGQIYDIDKQLLTTTRLSELNVFRNVPNPTYAKTADSTYKLDSRIDIIPLKRMTDRVEAEFLFNGGRYGYNIGNTFTNRNMFKRAAILQIKLNWSILFDNGRNPGGVAGSIENQDFKIGASISYPRLIVPFAIPVLGKYGVPHTTFSSNYQLFYQKGLVKRQSFINSITYDFFETPDKRHTFTPVSIEFSRGTIDPVAYDLLLAQNRFSYVYLIGRTIFTSSSQYTYQLNANKLNSYSDFLYFRGSIDIGGNTFAALSNIFKPQRDEFGRRTLFGYGYAQYAKTEVDLRLYRHLGNEKQFVFRINPGIGVPYGNSDELIFERNFYAGGANDMRAWLPRTLGPGQFNRASYGIGPQADTLRARLRYIDQYGEVKIIGNAEYRYKLADNFFGSKLKGAFFVDFGNVWRLKNQPENPNGEFRLGKLWESTAIGIGTGLRFDLTFFVFRFDMAFKFKDPQFSGADQYVMFKHPDEIFKTGDFKRAYRATNSEGYSFMQLNFGVGLPF